MAERRMFAKTIIDSDAFLDMPLSTQALYFHLSMRADDEGFVAFEQFLGEGVDQIEENIDFEKAEEKPDRDVEEFSFLDESYNFMPNADRLGIKNVDVKKAVQVDDKYVGDYKPKDEGDEQFVGFALEEVEPAVVGFEEASGQEEVQGQSH